MSRVARNMRASNFTSILLYLLNLNISKNLSFLFFLCLNKTRSTISITIDIKFKCLFTKFCLQNKKNNKKNSKILFSSFTIFYSSKISFTFNERMSTFMIFWSSWKLVLLLPIRQKNMSSRNYITNYERTQTKIKMLKNEWIITFGLMRWRWNKTFSRFLVPDQ